jgi:hypothetical protein
MLNAIRKIGLFVASVVVAIAALAVGAALFLVGGIYSAFIKTPIRWVNRLMGKTAARSSLTDGILNSLIVAVLFSVFALTSPVATGIMYALIFLNTFESVYDSLTAPSWTIAVTVDTEEEPQDRKTGATMNAATEVAGDTVVDAITNVVNGAFGGLDAVSVS